MQEAFVPHKLTAVKDFELFVYELIGAIAQFLVPLLGQVDKKS